MSMIAVLLAVQAAAPADIAVVIARREGVSKVQSQELAAHGIDVLRKAGLVVAAAPVDGLTCAGKRACLIALGRKNQHAVLVLLEAATILDDGVLRVEAVSIEEDGKRLAVSDYEGSLVSMAPLTPTFAKLTAPLLKATQGKAAVAAAAPKPPEPIVTPAPPPPAAEAPKPVEPSPAPAPVPAPTTPSVTAAAPPSSGAGGRTVAAIVMLGVGVAAGVGAGITGAQALAENEKVTALCPVRNQCADPQMPTRVNPDAKAAAERAQGAQTAGIILAASGAAVAVAGVVLLLTGAPASAETPKVSVFAAPGAVSASVSLAW